MMDKKIRSFIIRSVIGIIAICIIVFVWLTAFMGNKTDKTILGINELYMSEMNIQLQQKFSSVVNLRLQQVEGIVNQNPEKDGNGTQLLEGLRTETEVRGFTYLGFYTGDGGLETIYGEDIEFAAKHEDVQKSLDEDGNIIEAGQDKDGNRILMLGRKAAYPMKNGQNSEALIAGISMDYLNDALYLDTDDGRIYTHIIDKNGKFVIRNKGAYRESFFDRMRANYDELDGKNAETYVTELQRAMKANDVYYTTISYQGEPRQIYCSPIGGNSEWYLISVMKNSDFDENIRELDNVRLVVMIISLLIILLAMSVVFWGYYRLSRQQMEEINKARRDAIHASQAKSEFLSSMSHDIRTPMNAIIGMTDIALKHTSDQLKTDDCLRKIKLSSKHLLGLINDVLDMSKIESGKMTLNISQMSLKETMDDLVNIMQPQVKAENLYFDIFIDKVLAENVYCDSVRLNQVLLNILSNAVKYTPEKGRIDVHLYQEPSSKGDTYVRTHFRIKDTGIGMSEEFQQRIFDTFSRENTDEVQRISGTGLGMAITKAVVDMMEGEIELTSELGKGSEFHVILDFEKADEKAIDMMLPSWNVLVVDDNEQLCTSAVANLEELGVCAEWSLDGKKAVEMVEEHHKKNDDYHFVLLDWKMPGMDGMQVLREIRNRVGNAVPVFIISAYDWSDIEHEAYDIKISGFISKPLFKSTLFYCLRQFVEDNKREMESENENEIDFTGNRILLAEDIDINWEIAYEILSSVGFEVERAVNGQVCVNKFEQSEAGYYDVILMDIRMPVMDGYDATRAIRASEHPDKNIPIIAMTADAFSGDVQVCLDCGMNAHVAKPIDVQELMRTLQKYLE